MKEISQSKRKELGHMDRTSLKQTSVMHMIHPGLQKLIIEENWKGFKIIQYEAIPVILKGDDCIIEAPTAGGKTEAVLFPTLTRAAQHKRPSVQILYLAPLRALLNDIELRAKKYAEACSLHCFKWHGDVSQKDKIEELQNPPQLLLTTPESLEAILLRKAGWHRYFSGLEVIVVDEAHNFASGDRGSHIISLLERLDRSVNLNPQRIAMTATIGNPEEMLRWLAGQSRKFGKRIYVKSKEEKPKILEVQFFNEQNDIQDNPESFASNRQFETLYKMLPLKKSIVFAGSRTHTESLAAAINKVNKAYGSKIPIKVRTHHSAVSKYYREEAEHLIKVKDSIESQLDAIISTSTLELGIDVGALEQIIQVGGLSSSSAFLQRVGRTGRRPREPQFFSALCTSEQDLILLAAVVSLGRQEISETIHFPKKAYHLMAHQLICLCLQRNGIHPESAWEILSKAYCFSDISKLKFYELVKYMIQKTYLRDVDGLLVIGEKGEEKFLRSNWRRLFAVFDSGPMYDVWDGKKHVGTLDSAFVEALEIPFLFVLGGIDWEAFKVKPESREVFARKTRAGEAPKWVAFSGLDVPFETAKEAGKILFESEDLDYLNQEAKEGIELAREKVKGIGWTKDKWVIQTSTYGRAEIWTFAGDRINRTLAKLLIHEGIGTATSSYQKVTVKKADKDQSKLGESIVTFFNKLTSYDEDSIHDLESELFSEVRLSVFSKFVKCLPEDLWYEALAERIFDFEGLQLELKRNSIVQMNSPRGRATGYHVGSVSLRRFKGLSS